MQKTILTLAAASFALMSAAAPVSLNQAKAIAAGVTGGNGAKVPAARLELAQQAVNAQGETDYYVFNRADDKGFIIVAGDDRALPVLGYSDDGSFVPGETPCGLEYLLEVYSAEMSDLRSNPAARARKAVTLNSEVAPILTSTWDQSTPFNNQVPTINNRRCYTGCVATAISQVMYYYKWPETGTGSKTYTWKYTLNGQSYSTKLTANFASSTYDWANMLDSYSNGYNDDQAAAVSLLLKDVGYAVSMTYGTSSSGAADTQQAPALRDY
ncbi:MAG: C10 family peptidase, partial [Muribaculaceae bacterium]|nr:C10 family peptidase [Muribaculaceae bacterium]